MFKILTTFLSGIQGYLIVALVTGFGSAAGGYYVAHKIGQAEMLGIQMRALKAGAEAVAQAATEQKRLDHIGLDAALALDHQVLTIEVGSVQLITEIERHVTVQSIACVPYGLVRVLDAAVLGRSAESLALPAGQSDGTCAPIDAPTLARSIAANYGAARLNAAQLDALSATVSQITSAKGAYP